MILNLEWAKTFVIHTLKLISQTKQTKAPLNYFSVFIENKISSMETLTFPKLVNGSKISCQNNQFLQVVHYLISKTKISI